MFTGIIEEIGMVRRIQYGQHSVRLEIEAGRVLADAKPGDSIAVNGVCLTVTAMKKHAFSADVMHETLNCSNLAFLSPGSHVNLERAMRGRSHRRRRENHRHPARWQCGLVYSRGRTGDHALYRGEGVRRS